MRQRLLNFSLYIGRKWWGPSFGILLGAFCTKREKRR